MFVSDTTPQLGLDLQGGISVVLAPKAGFQAKSDTLGQAVNIIRNRVDSLGVAEPEISRQGNNIIIDLPGVKDRDKALRIVGQTAELRFRPVLQSLPAENVAVTTTTTTARRRPPRPRGATTTTAAGGATTTTAKASTSTTESSAGASSRPSHESTTAPTTTATTAPAATPPVESTTTTTIAPLTGVVKSTEDIPDQEVVLPIRKGSDDQGAARLRLGPTLMTGSDVKSARAAFESGQGWVVHLSFTGEGFGKFNDIAAKYVGQQISIVLDGVVQSYPVIRDAKFDTNDVRHQRELQGAGRQGPGAGAQVRCPARPPRAPDGAGRVAEPRQGPAPSPASSPASSASPSWRSTCSSTTGCSAS